MTSGTHQPRTVRIGTRGSPMALAQANQVASELRQQSPGLDTELVPITTSGDRWTGDLKELGGKGSFVHEIDRALQTGEVDLAVHCLKDMPGDRPAPEGIVTAAHLARESVQDAVITRDGRTLADLPAGAVIGTSSVRRRAQIALHHPYMNVTAMRGNANTRLSKLDNGEVDALVLAVAGLYRIGEEGRICETLPVDVMVPAVGAGIITLQCRDDDSLVRGLAGALADQDTTRHATAERAMLHTLQGHCNSPIAGLASTEVDGQLRLLGIVFDPDGKTVLRACEWSEPDEPHILGISVAVTLLRKGARALMDSIPH